MGKRADLGAKYLKLADEAMKNADEVFSQLKTSQQFVNEKTDSNIHQRLTDHVKEFNTKIETVKDDRADLEHALASRDRYKDNKQKMKDNSLKVLGGSLLHPMKAMKAFNAVNDEGNRTSKAIDDAILKLDISLGALTGSTKIANFVVENMLQGSSLNHSQETKAVNTQSSSTDFTSDDLDAFNSLDSGCQSKYNNFKMSVPLNDVYPVTLDNAAPKQELKQDQSGQIDIAVGNSDESTSNRFRM